MQHLAYCLLNWIICVQMTTLSIWDAYELSKQKELALSLSATCLLEASTSYISFRLVDELSGSLSFRSVNKPPVDTLKKTRFLTGLNNV